METFTAADAAKSFRINIATALNSKYMRYAYVMLTSLFLNQPDAEIHVYLLHSGLDSEEQNVLNELALTYHNQIHFLLVDKNTFPADLPTTEMWPLEAYYRLTLLDIIPCDVDRLLYIDVDMIINKPIKELYHTDFESFYFCVCRDMGVVYPFPDIRNELFRKHLSQENFSYFNSGLMLWNIRELRGKYCFKDYLSLAQKLNYQILAPDQDLLNYMHWNQVKFIDEFQYNLFSRLAYNNGIHYEDVKQETTIVHFPGMKPWEGEYIHYDIEQLWWDYAKMTPFYTEFLEEFVHDCLSKPTIYNTTRNLSNENKNLREELKKSGELCQKLLQLLENQN